MEQYDHRFGTYPLLQLLDKDVVEDSSSVAVLNQADEKIYFQSVPVPLTPLIGRESEILAAQNLLRHPEVRLVTLVGAGGIGKTHLALTLGNILVDSFDNGVVFIALDSIYDSELVVPAIAQALAVKEIRNQNTMQLLRTFLRDKNILLVLDNFEQLLPSAPHLSELLLSCPQVKILVTSRSVLHVWGEHLCRVRPLEIPDPQQLLELESLARVASVELFVQRAEAILPEFRLTAENAEDIAEICERLDGLPLALEQAAMHCNLLSPNAIVSRLEHPFDMLTGGRRDAPVRHHTLRNSLSWNDNLLTPDEHKLFRRLAVFEHGFTLQAAEEFMSAFGDVSISIFEGITSLLDKSMLQQTVSKGGEPRLYFLEILRAYGLELLDASGETEHTRNAPVRTKKLDLANHHTSIPFDFDFFENRPEEDSSDLRYYDTGEVVIDLRRPNNTAPHQRNHLRKPGRLLPTSAFEELTAREVEVLRLLSQGLSNKKIAEQLVLSPHTVSGHIQSIFGKLALNTRSAATRYALEHHLA